MSVKCPVCDTPFEKMIQLELFQSIICSKCGLELEVISINPLKLANLLDYKYDPSRIKIRRWKNSLKTI